MTRGIYIKLDRKQEVKKKKKPNCDKDREMLTQKRLSENAEGNFSTQMQDHSLL